MQKKVYTRCSHLHISFTGGGKLQNALEIIEHVNADEPPPPPDDGEVIAEMARINSIDKCNVWFEAHLDTKQELASPE